MSRNIFRVGETVLLTDNFTDEQLNDVDPTTVTLKLISPAGVQTSRTYAGGTVSKSSAGHFYVYFTTTETGPWRARWESTGYQDAAQTNFDIMPTEFSL